MKIGILSQVLAGQSVKSSFGQGRADKSKRYETLMRGINMNSYSTSLLQNACPRKLAINKLELASRYEAGIHGSGLQDNIDFAFGKAIESGVQGVLNNRTDDQVFMDMFLAWDIPMWQEHQKGYPKGFIDALIAIDKFKMIHTMLFQGWEIAVFNGKPAIELAMCLDLENGYYYVGHMDITLYNRSENRYRVLEIKTTGSTNIQEADYKNSSQAEGYSIILDNVAKDEEATRTFEVFYLVFATSRDEWILYQFTKSRSMRAGWINTLIQDTQIKQMYIKTGHFPKRGENCKSYGRPCQYIDTCDLSFASWRDGGEFDYISKEEIENNEIHKFDFRFKLSEIINTQQEMM